jgi:signal transduction histidine kinase
VKAKKEDEARLQEAARTAAMGSMGAGLAHELKTPLSTIDINLQLLQEEWANPVSDREARSAKRVQVIARSVAKINEIIRSFVRFAQDKVLKREPVDLNELIQVTLESDIGDVIKAQNRVGQIQITCDFQPDLPKASLDRVLIRQVLINLITNAVEAITGRGAINIRTWSDPGKVHVAVSDTGHGIAPEHLDKIWNLYFTTKPSGIGMGLPIVKRFVEAHQGTIRAENSKGQGATFTFSLPVKDA